MGRMSEQQERLIKQQERLGEQLDHSMIELRKTELYLKHMKKSAPQSIAVGVAVGVFSLLVFAGSFIYRSLD